MKRGVRILLLVLMLLPAVLAHAQTDIQAELDSFMAEIAPDQGPAVSARITIGDETWAAAGGLVDITGSEAAVPENRFRIASMSKTWLTVVVMQLAEQDVLALDDPVTKWLPEDITGQIANADQATIFQLATMTSGIPEYLNDDFFGMVAEDTQHPWTPEEVLPFAHDLPPSFAPGDGFEYVNTNYILLQLIVEASAGKPMHEVMQEQIFEPLGLEDTCVQDTQTCTEFVHGYEDFDGDGEEDDLTDWNDGVGLGDGALISTTADLTRFYQAVFVNHEILSEESVQQMIEAGQNKNEYGIGLEVSEGDNGLTVGHTGAVLGFTGAVYYAADLDATVVILYGSTGLDMAHIDGLLAIASGGGEGEDDEDSDE